MLAGFSIVMKTENKDTCCRDSECFYFINCFYKAQNQKYIDLQELHENTWRSLFFFC